MSPCPTRESEQRDQAVVARVQQGDACAGAGSQPEPPDAAAELALRELFPEGYVKGSTTLHRAFTTAYLVLVAFVFHQALGRLDGWQTLLALLALAAGAALADFLTALHHFTMDNYFQPSTPIIGRFVREFLDHHVRPRHILGTGLCQNFYEGGRMTLPLLVVITLLRPHPLLEIGAASLLTFISLGVSIHKWAHLPRPPWPISWLHRCGLLVDFRRHALHHHPPYDRDYAIITGWCNAPLARLRFFCRIERLVWRLTSVEPRSWARPAGSAGGRVPA